MIFGSGAKQQIAGILAHHVTTNFRNAASAAEDLKISRQRLFSYTAGKSLPGADVIDRIFERWGLDLVGGPRKRPSGEKPSAYR
jgi:hypothetical protein